MKATKQLKCWSCKHRTNAFKIKNLTHYHCIAPSYQKQADTGDPPSPWDTLRVFSDSCNEHKLR